MSKSCCSSFHVSGGKTTWGILACIGSILVGHEQDLLTVGSVHISFLQLCHSVHSVVKAPICDPFSRCGCRRAPLPALDATLNNAWLCSPGGPGTYCVVQTGLKLTAILCLRSSGTRMHGLVLLTLHKLVSSGEKTSAAELPLSGQLEGVSMGHLLD